MSLPDHNGPYTIYCSDGVLGKMHERYVGDFHLGRSQVYLTAFQNVGSAWAGAYYQTASMDTGKDAVSELDDKFDLHFTEVLEQSLAKEVPKTVFQHVAKESDPEISLIPACQLYNIGSEIYQFEFRLVARYKTKNAMRTSRRFFTWIEEDPRPITGKKSWLESDGRAIDEKAKSIIPNLVQAFHDDLKLNLGNTADAESNQRITYKRSDMKEPATAFILKKYEDFILASATAREKPIPNMLLLIHRSLLKDH